MARKKRDTTATEPTTTEPKPKRTRTVVRPYSVRSETIALNTDLGPIAKRVYHVESETEPGVFRVASTHASRADAVKACARANQQARGEASDDRLRFAWATRFVRHANALGDLLGDESCTFSAADSDELREYLAGKAIEAATDSDLEGQ